MHATRQKPSYVRFGAKLRLTGKPDYNPGENVE